MCPTVAMLVSVRVVSGASELQGYGLVSVPNEMYSLIQFYEVFSKGVLDTGDKFVLDDKFRNYDVREVVSEGMSPLAAKQTVPLTFTMADCLTFGKYITFSLQSCFTPDSTGSDGLRDATSSLMAAARRKCWHKLRDLSRLNYR